jgi:hypothetical protein
MIRGKSISKKIFLLIPRRRALIAKISPYRISGSANHIGSLIVGGGFRIDRIETGYMPGPKRMTFMYEGSAGPD